MRLRRLELIVIGFTLAFLCFIGGYFVGRTSGAVSIIPVVTMQNEPSQAAEAQQPELPETHIPEQGVPGSSGQITPPAAPSVPPTRDSEGRININLASRSELMDLPGIGPALSERIVDYRRDNGPFSKIDDIRNVSGIGERRFETIKNMITVG